MSRGTSMPWEEPGEVEGALLRKVKTMLRMMQLKRRAQTLVRLCLPNLPVHRALNLWHLTPLKPGIHLVVTWQEGRKRMELTEVMTTWMGTASTKITATSRPQHIQMKGRETALASNPESVFASWVQEACVGPMVQGIGPTTKYVRRLVSWFRSRNSWQSFYWAAIHSWLLFFVFVGACWIKEVLRRRGIWSCEIVDVYFLIFSQPSLFL